VDARLAPRAEFLVGLEEVPQHQLRHLRRIVLLTPDPMGVLDVRFDLLLEVSANRQREIA